MQDVLHDLGATDLALQFLRLPMHCVKAAPGVDTMPEPVEPDRRDLFGIVYEFLTKMCVFETGSGDVVNNSKIQVLANPKP